MRTCTLQLAGMPHRSLRTPRGFSTAVLAVIVNAPGIRPELGVAPMSKGLDKRKESKKKPAKTLQEKRAAKRAKKGGGSAPAAS